MCVLCYTQKWCRLVTVVMPWFVIQFIGLWAISQCLPPPFRLEFTSTRLACASVLLITILWYEVLLPRITIWRERRNAHPRRRRKLAPASKCCRRRDDYQNQNPCGGKYLCNYCGHESKRPLCDFPELGFLCSKDFNGAEKGGRRWNRWICCHEWMANSIWVRRFAYVTGSLSEGSVFFRRCYFDGLIISHRLLASALMNIRYRWIKIFRSVSKPGSSIVERERETLITRKNAEQVSCHESKSRKARRRGEERRRARLEKKLVEEEERKQREEVAKLVEERRRKLKAETDDAQNPRSNISSKEKEINTSKKKDKEKELSKDGSLEKSNGFQQKHNYGASESITRVGKDRRVISPGQERTKVSSMNSCSRKSDSVKTVKKMVNRTPSSSPKSCASVDSFRKKDKSYASVMKESSMNNEGVTTPSSEFLPEKSRSNSNHQMTESQRKGSPLRHVLTPSSSSSSSSMEKAIESPFTFFMHQDPINSHGFPPSPRASPPVVEDPYGACNAVSPSPVSKHSLKGMNGIKTWQMWDSTPLGCDNLGFLLGANVLPHPGGVEQTQKNNGTLGDWRVPFLPLCSNCSYHGRSQHDVLKCFRELDNRDTSGKLWHHQMVQAEDGASCDIAPHFRPVLVKHENNMLFFTD